MNISVECVNGSSCVVNTQLTSRSYVIASASANATATAAAAAAAAAAAVADTFPIPIVSKSRRCSAHVVASCEFCDVVYTPRSTPSTADYGRQFTAVYSLFRFSVLVS